MAFPVDQSRVTSALTSGLTTSTIDMPAGITAGDLLVLIQRTSTGTGTLSGSTGICDTSRWTRLVDGGSPDASGDIIHVLYRLADGTEGATEAITWAGQNRHATIVWRITGAADPGVTPPVLSTAAVGTSTTPDPTVCTPTGVQDDFLWLWLGFWEGEQDSPPATPPTNYTNWTGATTGTEGPDTGNCRVAGGSRQNRAASEDAGSTTLSIGPGPAWTAYVMGIAPAVSDNDASLYQAPVEVAISPTDAKARTYQESVEVAVSPTDAKGRAHQVVVEVALEAIAEARLSQLPVEALTEPDNAQIRLSQEAVEALVRVTDTRVRLSQLPVEALVRVPNPARISQEPIEAVVLPTDQKARVSQEPIEAVVLPTDQEARMSQLVIETVSQTVVAVPAFRAYIID